MGEHGSREEKTDSRQQERFFALPFLPLVLLAHPEQCLSTALLCVCVLRVCVCVCVCVQSAKRRHVAEGAKL
jgi:hypothetical protein